MDPSKILYTRITCCTSICQMADLAKQICWEWQNVGKSPVGGLFALSSLYLLVHMWSLII